MKLLFKKKLNEKMYSVAPGIKFFDYVGGMLNYIQNTGKEYRILYDGMIDIYMVCPAESNIHNGMLKIAFKDGWYEDYKDRIEEFTAYSRRDWEGYQYYGCLGYEKDDGEYEDPWIFYMVFSPNREWKLYDDGYDRIYHLTFGDLLTREFELVDIPDLYQAIGKDIEDVEECE